MSFAWGYTGATTAIRHWCRVEHPGKAFRKGITLKQIMRMFPDDATAESRFVEQRWPDGVYCPHCGSLNIQTGCKHKTMPFRCREQACGHKRFSVKTGVVIDGSSIGYQDWIIATFQLVTNLKSVSSMKLHRDLGISQKSGWFLAHRLRVAIAQGGALFDGPVEVDEAIVGGRRRNMHYGQRKELTGRGAVGKAAEVGARDRATKHVAANVVRAKKKDAHQGFVKDHAAPTATVYEDDAGAYVALPFDHAVIKHSLRSTSTVTCTRLPDATT